MRKEHHFYLSLPLNAAYPGHQRLKYLSQKNLFYKYTNFWVGKASMFPNFLNHSHQNEAFFNMLRNNIYAYSMRR
jgi:hypothetical protein